MTHLAYLGQMLEKGGGFAIGIFPEGWVLSWDCPIQTPISPCHTLCTTERYRVLVHRIVPRVWGLVPLGHVNPLLNTCTKEFLPGVVYVTTWSEKCLCFDLSRQCSSPQLRRVVRKCGEGPEKVRGGKVPGKVPSFKLRNDCTSQPFLKSLGTKL